MSIECNQLASNNNETSSLYPERVSLSAERHLKEIREYLSGERQQELLDQSEREELIAFERVYVYGEGELDEKKLSLAYIDKLSYNTTTIYPEYFDDTTEGQVILDVISRSGSTEIQKNSDGTIDIRKSLSALRKLDNTSFKKIKELSLDYHNKIILEKFSKHITEDGSLDIEGLDNPEKLIFIKNPEKLAVKLQKLKELQDYLERARSELFQEEASIQSEDINSSQQSLALIHAKQFRLDELIKKVKLIRAKVLEDKTILDAEEKDKEHNPPQKLDKYIHGVEFSLDSNRNYNQIGSHLIDQADEATEQLIEINKKKSEVLAENNIDKAKLEDANLNPEQVEDYINSILQSYGLLSEHPANAEQVAKNIKPKDNKWRCYKSDKNVFSIESKSKTLLIPNKSISMNTLLTTVLSHEIIHILQRENTAQIGLPLYSHPNQIGGARAELFQEGGAMYYQGMASKELFGLETSPWPHYTRAMMVKKAGGDYLDCVKAFYESYISVEPKNITAEKRNSVLKTAIDRAGRLFRNTPNLSSNHPSIPSSKDTAYLEQKAVVEEIIKHPELQNLILVSGINLETAKEMIRFGLLDLSKLRTPDLSFVQKIWDEEKHKYTLDSSDSETTQTSTPDQTSESHTPSPTT